MDDIPYAGMPNGMEFIRTIISKEFKAPPHGLAHSILGLEIIQNKNGILLHRNGYIKKALQKFGLTDAHPKRFLSNP